MQKEELVAVIDMDYQDLAMEYLENRKKEFVLLQELLSKRDFAQITILAHRLKGNAKTYGFAELTDIGQDLEKFSSRQIEEDCRRLIDAYGDYVSRVKMKFVKSGVA